MFAQVHRYRRVSSQRQRQQTKWVVFGFSAALAGYVAVISLHVVFPTLEPGTPADLLGIAATVCFMLLIPASIAFAVLRYRLYDIDLIINRTLVYGALTATLSALYFGSVVVSQKVFVAVAGHESTLAVVGLHPRDRRAFRPPAQAHPGVHRPPFLPKGNTTRGKPSRPSRAG